MGGWLVGKSDFNENPVVSPDLDLDFGLRLRVCQFQIENRNGILKCKIEFVKDPSMHLVFYHQFSKNMCTNNELNYLIT